jgi:acyl-CoA-binding protein
MSAGGGGGVAGASDGGGGGPGSSPAASSRLPYPERFHAAVRFVDAALAKAADDAAAAASNGNNNNNSDGKGPATVSNDHADDGATTDSSPQAPLSDEARLLFYALGKQATEGPCAQPKPWAWDVVASAKWQSWSQLGQMGKVEAMRLYVKTLEEEAPGWAASALALVPSSGGGGGVVDDDSAVAAAAAAAGPPPSSATNNHKPPPPADAAAESSSLSSAPASIVTSLRDACVPGRWVALQLPDGARRPSARYEHASALMAGRLYVVGGHLRGGRALADVWSFDLERLAWTPLWTGGGGGGGGGGASSASSSSASSSFGPPALIGHTVTPYRGKLVVVGGHVRLASSGSGAAGLASSDGATDPPPQQQAADDFATAAAAAAGPRRPRNRAEAAGDAQVWVFDPLEQRWACLRPAAPLAPAPCARGAHTAVALGTGGSELHVYGGEDASRRPLGDLWVLDLDAAVVGGGDDAVANWRRVEPAMVGGGGSGGGGVDNGDTSADEQAAAVPLLPRRSSRIPPECPPARSAHAASAYQQGRYMVVYGGAAMATCLSDTWVYDRDTGAWLRAQGEGGADPGARAGHAGARLGEAWFVLGGGDHVRGCRDVLAADLSEVPAGRVVWSRVSTVPVRSPLSSEGGSLTAVPSLGALLAFGGYNGRCHDALSLYSARKEMIDPFAKEGGEAAAAAGGGGGGGLAAAEQQGGKPDAAAAAAAAAPDADAEAPLLSSLGRAVSALFGSSSSLKGPPPPAGGGGGGGGEQGAEPQQQKQQEQQQEPPSLPTQQSASLSATADEGNAAPPPPPSGAAPERPRSPHEQALLRDLAVQREVLRREVKAAREELADARRERQVEVAALKRALADAERGLAEERRRREELERQLACAGGRGGAEAAEAAAKEEAAAAAEQQRRREEGEARAAAAAVAGGGGVWGLFASVPPPSSRD